MIVRQDFKADYPEDYETFLFHETESFLSSSHTDLKYSTAEDSANIIERCRKLQHDHLIHLECRRLGVGFIHDSRNKVKDFMESYPPKNPIPSRYWNQTPDIMFFDTSGVLHVRDVTFTSSDPQRARDTKIIKYAYFLEAYTSTVTALALTRSSYAIEEYLVSNRVPESIQSYTLRLFRRYLWLISQAEKNPDFPVIQSLLNSSPIPIDKFDHFEVDYTTVPEPLIVDLFGSKQYFNDFLKLTGPFKGFAYPSDDDEIWERNLLDIVDTKIKSMLPSQELTPSDSRFKLATKKFRQLFDSSLSHLPNEPVKEFYKIIPVPFVNLNKMAEPRLAVETTLSFFPVLGHQFIDTLVDSLRKAFSFTAILPYFRGSVEDPNYKEKLKDLIRQQEPYYRANGSRIVARRTFQVNFHNLGIHKELVRLTGIDLLKEQGKTVEKQSEHDSKYHLDHGTDIVKELADWFIQETGGLENMLINPDLEGSFGLSKDILSECKLELNVLLTTFGGANVFKLADFYTKLYKEIAFMGDTNHRSNNVVVSTLGSDNCLLILHGGGPLSRQTTRRKFWLIFKDCLGFPVRSSNRVVNTSTDWKIMLPINVDTLTAAHHLMTKKFCWDVCFGHLLESGKRSLSYEDKVDLLFTKTIARFNNTKPVNILLMTVRYAALASSAFFCYIELLLEKMMMVPRNILVVYFMNTILNALDDFHDIKSGRHHRFKSDIGQNPEDDTVRTKIVSPRFLGPGYHDRSVDIINEAYYYCGVSKEIRSRYHAMSEAFNKLLESKSKYDKMKELDPWLVRGFNPMMSNEDFLSYYLGKADQTCFNAKALDVAGKRLKQKVSANLLDIRSNLDHRMTITTILTFATNKSMVVEPRHNLKYVLMKERNAARAKEAEKLKKLRSNKRSYKARKLIAKMETLSSLQLKMKKGRARMYDWAEEPLCSKDMELSAKGKAIQAGYSYIHGAQDLKICTLYKKVLSKFSQAFFTLFPKPQDGGGREIAVQDFYTRVSNFLLERMTESICKYFQEEMITKATRKTKIQAEMVSKGRNTHRASMLNSETRKYTLFDNCDHTRWGPSHNVLSFLISLRCFFLGDDEKYFHYYLMGVFRMCSKVIEVPKELLLYWTRDFKSDEMSTNPALKKVIDAFKREGKTTFECLIGMMQGINNLGSTCISCCRTTLVDFLVQNSTFLKDKLSVEHMVSSDDKFSVMVASTKAATPEKRREEVLHICSCMRVINKITGLLCNTKESDAKSQVSMEDAEFNSLYYIDGTFVPRHYIDFKSLSSMCKAISYESDVLSMFNGIQSLAYKGLPENLSFLFQVTGYENIDSLYSLDKRFSRTKIVRPLLPIELGGNPILTTMEMLVGVKSCQSVRILAQADTSYHRALCLINSEDINEDSQESDEPIVSGISVNFFVRLSSRIDGLIHDIKEIGCPEREEVKSFIDKEPWLAFVDPCDKSDMIMKIMNRVYSHQSKVAFSYENDISNLIRMVRLSSNKVCYIGKMMRFEETSKVELKEFVVCVKEFLSRTDDFTLAKERLQKLLYTDCAVVSLYHTLSTTLLVRDTVGRLVFNNNKSRTSPKTIILQTSPLPTRNQPLNVIISKWFPTSNSRTRGLIKSVEYVDKDFLQITSMFPEIKSTAEETSLSLFGVESAVKEAFEYVVNLLRRKARETMTLYTKSSKTIFDRDFVMEYYSNNISKNKEFRVGDGDSTDLFIEPISSNVKMSHFHRVLSTLTSMAVMISDSDLQSKTRTFREAARSISSTSSYSLGFDCLADVCTGLTELEMLMMCPSDKMQKNLIAIVYQISNEKGLDLKDAYMKRNPDAILYYLSSQARLPNGRFDTFSNCNVLVLSENVSCQFKLVSGRLQVTTPKTETKLLNITKHFKSLFNNVFSDGRVRNSKLLVSSSVPEHLFTEERPGSTNCLCLVKGTVYLCNTSLVSNFPNVKYYQGCTVRFKEISRHNYQAFEVEDDDLEELDSFSLGIKIGNKDLPIFKLNRQMFDPTSITCSQMLPHTIYGDFLDLFNSSTMSDYPSQFIPDFDKIKTILNKAEKTEMPLSPAYSESEASLADIEDPNDFDIDFDYEANEGEGNVLEEDEDFFSDLNIESLSWGNIKPSRARYLNKYNELCKTYIRRIFPKTSNPPFVKLPTWIVYYFWNCVMESCEKYLEDRLHLMKNFKGHLATEQERKAIWNSLTILSSNYGFIKSVSGETKSSDTFVLLRMFLREIGVYDKKIYLNYKDDHESKLRELGISAEFEDSSD